MLTGDWVALAKELEISDSDINIIKSQYPDNIPQQAIVMLRLWMQTAGNKATGNTLEKALRSIHRDDIVDECICNVEVVTDDSEKATAEEVIDRFEIAGVKGDVVPEKTEPSPPGEICYEEKDMMKEAESADEEEISHKIRPDGFTQPSGEPSQMVHGDTPPPTDVKPSVTATELDASQTKPTEKETEVLTTAVSRSTTSTEAPPESTLKEADLAVLDSIVATQEAEVEEMVFTESESTKRKSSAVEEEAGSSSSSKTEAGKRVPPPIPPRKILPEPPGRGAPESLLLEKVKKASGELEPQQSSSDEGDEQLALMKDSPRWEEEEIQNEEPSDERPIKAEIKLLVKTTEVGKESIEIRSIREFVDKNAAEKEAKSDPPQPPEPTTITTTTTTQSTTTTTTTDDKKPSTRQKTSTKGKGRGKSNPRFVRPSEGGGASNEQGNNDDFNLMAQVRDLISVDDKEKELGSHSADFEESSKSEMKQKEKKTKPTT